MSFCHHLFPCSAVPMVWWMAQSVMTNDTDGFRDGSHLKSVVHMKSPHRHKSRNIWSNRMFQAYIDERPPSLTSISNGSGPSLRVRVRVQSESFPNWRSRSLIKLNRPLGYGLMVYSQTVWIGLVVSGSPSGSSYRFILRSCICSLLIVSHQNHVFSNQ